VWNDECVFLDVDELPRSVLVKVTLYDADTLSSDVLGSFTVNLGKFATTPSTSTPTSPSSSSSPASSTSTGGGLHWYSLKAAANQSKGVLPSGEVEMEVLIHTFMVVA
jgi:hypothetical protein